MFHNLHSSYFYRSNIPISKKNSAPNHSILYIKVYPVGFSHIKNHFFLNNTFFPHLAYRHLLSSYINLFRLFQTVFPDRSLFAAALLILTSIFNYAKITIAPVSLYFLY